MDSHAAGGVLTQLWAAFDHSEEDDQRRDDVQDPNGHFEPVHGWREVDGAANEGADDAVRRDRSRQVESRVVLAGQPAELLELRYRVAQDATGHDDQRGARPEE